MTDHDFTQVHELSDDDCAATDGGGLAYVGVALTTHRAHTDALFAGLGDGFLAGVQMHHD